MTVSYRQIVDKMLEEVQTAKSATGNDAVLKKHIAKVVSLGELILDDQVQAQVPTNQMPVRTKMLARPNPAPSPVIKQPSKPGLAEDDEGSIFDF